MFGMDINSVGLTEVFEAIDRRIEERGPGYIVTPNVDHVCLFQTNDAFRDAYRNAFLVLPDGMAVMWAGALLGRRLREKISGSDLIFSLTEHAARQGHSVFFMGGAGGVAEQTAHLLAQRYPVLKVAGHHSPPMGFDEDPEANAAALRQLRESSPDICYVAMGSPRQEIWIAEHHAETGVPVTLGIGGSFDFVTGAQKRAPRFAQRIGMEWLWRLCHEPLRLWRRYLVRDPYFFVLLWREIRGKKWTGKMKDEG